MVLSIFHTVFVFHLSFVECLFNSFVHFRNYIILVVVLWGLFLYSGYKSIVRYMCCRLFTSVGFVYVFSSLSLLLSRKFFDFDKVQFTLLWFICVCVGGGIYLV